MIQHKPKKSGKKSGKMWRNIGLVVLAGVLMTALFARDQIQTFLYGTPAADDTSAVVIEPQQDVDVNGEWLGIVTEDYGANVRYEYRVNLRQTGDTISGMMTVISTNNPYGTITAVSTVEGNVEGDDLMFREMKVTRLDGISANNWCRIRVTLDHEDGDTGDTLTGTWQGVETEGIPAEACTSTTGRITLMQE